MPALGYGFSDCHCARDAWGSIAYGFIPFRYGNPLVNLKTKHGGRIRTEASNSSSPQRSTSRATSPA